MWSYRELLGMLIGEWRAIWSENLPFLIVQLPQWIDKKVDETEGDPMLWPVLREAQWDAAQSIDNVYVICTIDCGEYDNIHPVDKRTPGERLADCALRQVYGMSRIPVYGPTVLGFRCDPNGRVRLFFRYAHGLHFDGTTPGSRNQLRCGAAFAGAFAGELRFRACGRGRRVPSATAAIFVDCDIDDLVNSKVNVSITTPPNSAFPSTAAASARSRWHVRMCRNRCRCGTHGAAGGRLRCSTAMDCPPSRSGLI
mgnify:CR=1 FL=1